MSVTFRVEGCEYVEAEVECCVCNGTGLDGGYPQQMPCPYCNGTGRDTETVVKEPFFDIDLANGNARDFLRIIDPAHAHEDLCGRWEGPRLMTVYRNAFNALNRNTKKNLVREFSRTGNFVEAGRDLGYVERRLTQFIRLFQLATEHKRAVVFA